MSKCVCPLEGSDKLGGVGQAMCVPEACSTESMVGQGEERYLRNPNFARSGIHPSLLAWCQEHLSGQTGPASHLEGWVRQGQAGSMSRGDRGKQMVNKAGIARDQQSVGLWDHRQVVQDPSSGRLGSRDQNVRNEPPASKWRGLHSKSGP